MKKMKYKIIASDSLYRRMLKLELDRLGFIEAGDDANDYQVLLAEGLTELPPVRRLRGAVFIDCGLLMATLPEQVKVLLLERPFSLLELREFLCELAEKSLLTESDDNQLIISREDLTVTYGEHVIKLTPREFNLLDYLHSRPGTIVRRSELLRELWKDENARDTNVVDVYVRFLRSKLDEPLGVRLIRAVRGEGYVYSYENEMAQPMAGAHE